MSNFASAAFCFLTSPKRGISIRPSCYFHLQIKYFQKEWLIAPNPTTERGRPTIINVHPTEKRIIYPS